MKKQQFFIYSILAVTLLFAIAPFAFAQNTNPFAHGIKSGAAVERGWPPKVTSCVGDSSDFGTCMLFVLNKVLAIIYTLALFLAVIFLVYAGIEYITKPGEAGKTHQRLVYGITGIVVAVVAFSLVKAIELGLTGGTGGGGSTPPIATEPEPGTGGGGNGSEEGDQTPVSVGGIKVSLTQGTCDESSFASTIVCAGITTNLQSAYKSFIKTANAGSINDIVAQTEVAETSGSIILSNITRTEEFGRSNFFVVNGVTAYTQVNSGSPFPDVVWVTVEIEGTAHQIGAVGIVKKQSSIAVNNKPITTIKDIKIQKINTGGYSLSGFWGLSKAISSGGKCALTPIIRSLDGSSASASMSESNWVLMGGDAVGLQPTVSYFTADQINNLRLSQGGKFWVSFKYATNNTSEQECTLPGSAIATVQSEAIASASLPQVIVQNVKITAGRISFLAKLNQTGTCTIAPRVFNTTKNIFSSTSISLNGNSFGAYQLDFPQSANQSTQARDNLILTFDPNTSCQIPSQTFALTVPATTVAGGGGSTVAAQPTIPYLEPYRISAQQTFRVMLPTSLRDAFIQVVDIFLNEAELYDPPFYLYMKFDVQNPPTRDTACTLVAQLSGARITGFSRADEDTSIAQQGVAEENIVQKPQNFFGSLGRFLLGQTAQTTKPKMIITAGTTNASSIDVAFVAKLNAAGTCYVTARTFNIRTAGMQEKTVTVSSIPNSYVLPFPNGTQANDRLLVTFLPNTNCTVPADISITAPSAPSNNTPSNQDVIAISSKNVRFFTTLVSFNLRLDAGRTGRYIRAFSLPLSSNVIRNVKVRPIELRNCQYTGTGGDIANTGYRVDITSQ